MAEYFIGIDVSTTATKALLVGDGGQIIAGSSRQYAYQTPYPLWSEQDPNLWWDATIECVREITAGDSIKPESIKGFGLTGQMHGLVILDENGNVLRPSILWNDQRTQRQCDNIRKIVGKETFINVTGNDALTGFTAPKILWVKDNEPEIYKKIRHILLPKDFVRYKLTGLFAIDKAGGSGTVLFNLKNRDWSKYLLHELGLTEEWFPETYEGTEMTGELAKSSADLLGLPANIPVFAGGGDQAAAAVGTGAVKEGIVSISLGTSGVVFASTDLPRIEPEGRLHAFCHAVSGKWHLMGVMLSAAGSLRWFRDTFNEKGSFEELTSGLDAIDPGSEGLLFLPYLTGERTPYPDPLAKGAFVGITVRHGFDHFTRAVLEGVAFGLRDCFELLKRSGVETIDQVRITGGGAKNPLWRQIIADVLGLELVTITSEEGAAFGAALLAACGAGMFNSVEEACNCAIRESESVLPGENLELYESCYQKYRRLYPALKDTFHQ